jgi:hypothetical protein
MKPVVGTGFNSARLLADRSSPASRVRVGVRCVHDSVRLACARIFQKA